MPFFVLEIVQQCTWYRRQPNIRTHHTCTRNTGEKTSRDTDTMIYNTNEYSSRQQQQMLCEILC